MAAAAAVAAAGHAAASAVPTAPPTFVPHLSFMEGQFATHALILEQQRRIKTLEAELAASQLELMQLRASVHASNESQSNACGIDGVGTTTNASPAPNERRIAEDAKKGSSRYWTPDEHARFLEGLELFGQKDIKAISRHVGTRSATQVRTHAQKYYLRIERERAKAEGITPRTPSSRDRRPNHKGRPRSRVPGLGTGSTSGTGGGGTSMGSHSAESGSPNGVANNRSSSSIDKTDGGESGDMIDKTNDGLDISEKGDVAIKTAETDGRANGAVGPASFEKSNCNAQLDEVSKSLGSKRSGEGKDKRGLEMNGTEKHGTKIVRRNKVERTKKINEKETTLSKSKILDVHNVAENMKNEALITEISKENEDDNDKEQQAKKMQVKVEAESMTAELPLLHCGGSRHRLEDKMEESNEELDLENEEIYKNKRHGREAVSSPDCQRVKRVKIEKDESGESDVIADKLDTHENGECEAGIVGSQLPPRFGERTSNGLVESGGSMSNLRTLLPSAGMDGMSGGKITTLRRNGSSSSVLADLSKNVGVLSRSNSFLLPNGGKGVTRTNSILSLLSGIPTTMRESPSTERLLGLDNSDEKIMLASLKNVEMDGHGVQSHDNCGENGSQSDRGEGGNVSTSAVGSATCVVTDSAASIGALGDRSFSFGQLNHIGVDDLEDAGAVALSIHDDHKWNDG